MAHYMQIVDINEFIEGGIIRFSDGTSVSPEEIISVVDDALNLISERYESIYHFMDTFRIMFPSHCVHIKTIGIGGNRIIYVNPEFICRKLNMDRELIGAVIMHEVLHVKLRHIERNVRWMKSHHIPVNVKSFRDGNLAADAEVNWNLVNDGMISRERLVNDMHGVYLDGMSNVVMEDVLANEGYMNILRSECGI